MKHNTPALSPSSQNLAPKDVAPRPALFGNDDGLFRMIGTSEFDRISNVRPELNLFSSVANSPFWFMLKAGISCLPVAADGSKRPLVKWKVFQSRFPTSEEINEWIRNYGSNIGIAAITGCVSGGVEVLDFDHRKTFDSWYAQARHVADALTWIQTPSGGLHGYYRCSEICGNLKIAVDHSVDKPTLIESRGEGGYTLTPYSAPSCHHSGLPYVQVGGPSFPNIPSISLEQRRELWRIARTFDRADTLKHQIHKPLARNGTTSAVRPAKNTFEERLIAQFNETKSWKDLLLPAGWTTSDGLNWTRPGKKDRGTSARVNSARDGVEVLTVFSSNAGPVAAAHGAKSINKFTFYMWVRHGGSYVAAINSLLGITNKGTST